MALSWLFSMVNPGLAPEAQYASIGRYAVIFASFFSIALRGGVRIPVTRASMSTATLALGLFVLVHSVMFSRMPDVSITKLIAWLVTALTLLGAWQRLSTSEQRKAFKELRYGLVTLCIISIPLLAVPSIGYLRNDHGFQGVLAHPQAFGPLVALAGALLLGEVLAQQTPRWTVVGMLMLCPPLILASQSRGAGLALFCGIAAAFVTPLFSRTRARVLVPGLYSSRVIIGVLVSLAALVIAAPLMSSRIEAFVSKGSGTADVVEAMTASRGTLVDLMIANIEEQPWSGIGFGIASDPWSTEIERDPVFGLPLSAPIEKGVLPVAIVEELGVLGAALALCWILVAVRHSAAAGAAEFAVVITLLFVNFGEAMLFSVGGMGMILLILLTGATSRSRPGPMRKPAAQLSRSHG